jgi:hypothetical protein
VSILKQQIGRAASLVFFYTIKKRVSDIMQCTWYNNRLAQLRTSNQVTKHKGTVSRDILDFLPCLDNSTVEQLLFFCKFSDCGQIFSRFVILVGP